MAWMFAMPPWTRESWSSPFPYRTANIGAPDGTDRWVLRAAMQGLLPDDVRLNRRLGMQAADVGQRLIDSSAEVDRTLSELEASQLVSMYLDVPRLNRAWESLKQEIGPQTTHATVTILTRGIMAGLHLLDRERAS